MNKKELCNLKKQWFFGATQFNRKVKLGTAPVYIQSVNVLVKNLLIGFSVVYALIFYFQSTLAVKLNSTAIKTDIFNPSNNATSIL